jgi:general secretion pathway protein D
LIETNKLVRCLSALLIAGFTVSCKGPDIRYREANIEYQQAQTLINAGKTEAGISKLESLAERHPERAEYRAYLRHQLDNQTSRMLRDADIKRQQRQWSDAEILYRQVLERDAQNPRAQEGLHQLGIAYRHEKLLSQAQELLTSKDLDAAQNIVRNVLAEDNANSAGRAMYEEIERIRIDKAVATPQIRSAFKKPITLEFRNTPVRSVFEFISRASNINFTYDRDLGNDQRTNIFVRNTTIEDAIQMILTTNQLDKKVLNENTILIYPLSRSAEYQELFVRTFYLNSLDAKRALNLIKTVLKSKDVYIDEKLNTLVMRDTPEAIKNAEKLIASQDLLDPEVMLEVEVMEINRRALEAIGIRYPNAVSVGVMGGAINGASGTAGNPVSGQLSLAELKSFNSELGVFTITDPVLALNLLNQDTDTNLLANPHIRVKNREKAKIHVGDRIPVLTSIANATGFVSQSVSYIEVGLKLDVEPTVMLNDEVSIKVGLEVSNQTDQVRTTSGTLTYTIGTRNANTILRLKNGETQVLAGLFRDDEQRVNTRVPLLGNLPLVGRLFTDKNNDKRKKEIVLLITPRILSNIAPQHAVYTTFPSGFDVANSPQPGAPSGRAGRRAATDGMPATPNGNQARGGSQAEAAAGGPDRADRNLNDPSVMRPLSDIGNPEYGNGM